MIDSEKIKQEFKRIQSLGFLKSNRTNNTGIGKTFEDYLGVRENNSKDPDFEGFEVKSQREKAFYITLFTKNPTHPKGANRYLKDTFGKPDAQFPDLKVLHISIFGDRFNGYNGGQFGFKMLVKEDEQKLCLEIKDLTTGAMIDNEIYWDFDKIQGKKLKNTFIVWADTKRENGEEYFHFTRANIYYNFSFNKLVKGIKEGYVMFDIRIGSYKTGSKRGKPHDHGSGFRVKRDFLKELFEYYIEVE